MTKVNGSWIKNGNTHSDQYSITTDSSGNWSGNIDVQIDAFDSGYTGSGDYIFKVGRYSSSGSGPTWSEEKTIKINAKEVSASEEADEEIGVINLSKISPTTTSEVLAEYKEPEEKIEKIKSLEKYRKVTTQSATSLQINRSKEEPSSEVKSKNQINSLIITGGLIILGTLGFSVYSYDLFRLKSKLDEIQKLFRR